MTQMNAEKKKCPADSADERRKENKFKKTLRNSAKSAGEKTKKCPADSADERRKENKF